MTVSVALETDSVTLFKDLVRQGFAPAVLPYGALKHELEAGTLSACPIIEPEIRSDLNLLYLIDRPPTRVAAHVVQVLIDILRDILASETRHGFIEVHDRPNSRRPA